MSTGHVNDMNNCAAGGICWSFEVGKALGGAVGWQQRKNTTGDEEFLMVSMASMKGEHAGGVVRSKHFDVLSYNHQVESLRLTEYPTLQDAVYLDHAGTTPYAKSLIEEFSRAMTTSLLGNPHSSSQSSLLSTRMVEDVRLRTLRFFNADPDHFDLVFVANATAGIKLVLEGFRAHQGGFWYGYHKDAHTSLIGLREDARESHCFGSDAEVDRWLGSTSEMGLNEDGSGLGLGLGLFGYPAQSNMNGRRLPLSWSHRVRSSKSSDRCCIYTLLDAAALVSTSPLDLSDVSTAPDYTVLSFYKIFGFPDLGGLIVRKLSASPLLGRKYFGGGTVEMVTCSRENWHVKKQDSLHELLEDGTLPIHSILALECALNIHGRLFGSIEHVSSHTSFLASQLYNELSSLRHGNGLRVCQLYPGSSADYQDFKTQGPTIALNFINSHGEAVSNAEVEKLAAVKNIHLRSGGLCNPGGIASSLDLAPWEMKRNFSAGQRCGNDNDIMGGKPTGVIRLSFGATSTLRDVEAFTNFVKEFLVESRSSIPPTPVLEPRTSDFYVETLSIYPIKSCGGWQIQPDSSWIIQPEGLAWDREWCLVHQGSRTALSQKRYPRMALLRPRIDLEKGVLRVGFYGPLPPATPTEITVPLSADPSPFQPPDASTSSRLSRVCGDPISAHIYASASTATFFTNTVGTTCTLARFPAAPPGLSTRHSKAHLQHNRRRHHQQPPPKKRFMPGTFPLPNSSPQPTTPRSTHPILLSNESPILTISRSSLNRLNETIKLAGGKAAHASVFRANIILAQAPSSSSLSSLPQLPTEQAYAEDNWTSMRILSTEPDQEKETAVDLDILSPCRRCNLICIDQTTAEKNEEPFVTLAKTRRGEGGKVFFGVHTALRMDGDEVGGRRVTGRIKVGDRVVPMRGAAGE
ncbi:MAG: hypothetical protein Q9190_004546 [Brigantiaea leucoxantha]